MPQKLQRYTKRIEYLGTIIKPSPKIEEKRDQHLRNQPLWGGTSFKIHKWKILRWNKWKNLFSIYRSPWGHNIILAYLTIIMYWRASRIIHSITKHLSTFRIPTGIHIQQWAIMGHKNNNSGLLWGIIIIIWGLHGYKNNNKGVTLTTTRDFTSNIGP